MTTTFGASAGVWNSDLGEFISEAHSYLAEILNDYNRDFSLVFIPKNQLRPGDKPFAILHSPAGLAPYIVRYLTEEDMKNPQAVLAWVFENDTTRTDVLAKLEAADAARQAFNLKERESAIEEQIDMMRFMAKTPLHTFKADGRTYRK